VVRTLLHGRGYQLAVSAEEERRLTLDVLVAIQQGYDILQQRQEGRLSETMPAPCTVLPAAWEPPAPVAPAEGPTWADLLAHWKADRPRVARTEFEVKTLLNSLGGFVRLATPRTLTQLQVTEWLRHERDERGNVAKTLEK
jgi:hypothetical protein